MYELRQKMPPCHYYYFFSPLHPKELEKATCIEQCQRDAAVQLVPPGLSPFPIVFGMQN